MYVVSPTRFVVGAKLISEYTQLRIMKATLNLKSLEFLVLQCSWYSEYLDGSHEVFMRGYSSVRKQLADLLRSRPLIVQYPALQHIHVSCIDYSAGVSDDVWQLKKLDNGGSQLEYLPANAAQVILAQSPFRTQI